MGTHIGKIVDGRELDPDYVPPPNFERDIILFQDAPMHHAESIISPEWDTWRATSGKPVELLVLSPFTPLYGNKQRVIRRVHWGPTMTEVRVPRCHRAAIRHLLCACGNTLCNNTEHPKTVIGGLLPNAVLVGTSNPEPVPAPSLAEPKPVISIDEADRRLLERARARKAQS